MSKHAASPTARLLQSSRLFSLPRPLPLQPELTTGLYRTSETATTSHPTHQAITTPASSYSRGDWGLKRAIPSKRKKSNPDRPTIRVRANDTYEHITDFTSAGDHVQTLRKWQQMEVPLMHSSRNSRVTKEKQAPLSAFEDRLDNTDPEATSKDRTSVNGRIGADGNQATMKRWKYEGPWLGGMQDGQFEQYLKETVHHGSSSRSKGALTNKSWREFVSDKLVEEKMQVARRRARNREDPMSEEQAAELLASGAEKPTAEELRDFQKRLRDNFAADGLSSSLTALICEFLDLPSVYTPPVAGTSQFNSQKALQILDSGATESGPPTTHPSAGLSHLRTKAIMYNHPLYGPQKDKPPIESRVVRPRTTKGQVQEHLAKLGVGGIVTEDSVSATGRNPDSRSVRGEDRMAHSIDENLVGGNKMWVHPENAHIDHRSRIRLAVSRAGPEAVAVKKGDENTLGEIWEAKSGNRAPAQSAYAMLPESMRSGSRASREPVAPTRRYAGVTGFDAELDRGQ